MKQSEYAANSLIVDTINTRMMQVNTGAHTSRTRIQKLNIALIRQERMTKLTLVTLSIFIAYITYLVVAKLISL